MAPFQAQLSSYQAELKGEDTFAILHDDPIAGTLLAVFDGHCGRQASSFCQQALRGTMVEALAASGARSGSGDAEQIAYALAACALELQRQWSITQLAVGATCTIVHQRGALVSVATLGDSLCWIDTGASTAALSVSHRLGANAEESHRLAAGEAAAAGRGPSGCLSAPGRDGA